MRNPGVIRAMVALLLLCAGAAAPGNGNAADEGATGVKVVHPEVPRIPAEEVKEMIGNREDFVLVDTNPSDHFELWHIETAVNIPYLALGNDPSLRREMLGPLPKDKLIVLYCLCEEGADSAAMALMLRGMGFRRDRVKVLEGGLIKWDEAGYPMIRTEIPE